MFKAADIMTSHVVSVKTDDTVDKALSMMIRHRISGLPVLDGQRRVVGIVSEYDLLLLICEGHRQDATVSDYMATDIVALSEDDSWVTVADTFRSMRIRRLPVLRDGELMGIVTRHDLMHAIRDARRQVWAQLTRVHSRVAPVSTGISPPSARKGQTSP